MTKGETVCAIAPEYADFKYTSRTGRKMLFDDSIGGTPMKTYMANPDKIERKWYVEYS